MAQIGELAAGIGVATTLNLQFAPEYVMLGTIDGDGATNVLPVTAMSWNIAGKERVNVTGQGQCSVLAQYKSNPVVFAGGSHIANIITVADGYLANQQFQFRATNSTAAAVAVFGFSRRMFAERIVQAAQAVVVDGASQRFQNFVMAAFDPSNVTRVDLTFINPKTGRMFSDSFSPVELLALFALDNISGETGLLGADQLVVDNVNLEAKMGMVISDMVVYTTGGNTTVMVEGFSKL